MSNTTKIEFHRFELYGEQTVSAAAELIGKMPNGWKLKKLEYTKEYGVGSWVAIAEGPKDEV